MLQAAITMVVTAVRAHAVSATPQIILVGRMGTTALILMQQFLFTFRLLLQVLILHRPLAPWVDTNPPRVLQAACHVWLATIRHWWDLKTVRVALRVVIKPPLVRLAVHIAEAVHTQRAVQAHAAIAEAVHTQRAAQAHVSVAEVVHTR